MEVAKPFSLVVLGAGTVNLAESSKAPLAPEEPTSPYGGALVYFRQLAQQKHFFNTRTVSSDNISP